MFNLNCYIDLNQGRPGMLIPLISSDSTNMPYVQQMDEFFIIKNLMPFLEYDCYPLVSPGISRDITLGDQGLIAFRNPDGSIFCGNAKEALAFLSTNSELVSQDALLRMQLNRIESLELPTSRDGWRDAADWVFESQEQKRLWIDAETHVFLKQKQIWNEIDPAEKPNARNFSSIEGQLLDYSIEYLIRWISLRKNFHYSNWSSIWHKINERAPLDQRLGQIAIEWLYANGARVEGEIPPSDIIFSVLSKYKFFDTNWQELAEFLTENVYNDWYHVFEALRSSIFIERLLPFLAAEAETESVLRIVEFAVQNIPKNDKIINLLSSTVESILERESGDAKLDNVHNDDFSESSIMKLIVAIKENLKLARSSFV